ncbi:hypothetical protein HPP92_002041 [Vanilla planifolia]|uniref:Survival of motor neuron-related-splicing factor 30 n=1 Tax=Vanilla planifolia TaxID=51239 RepID=A0A835VHM1_VANPL|nr:hypothetical protein HPP92_002041 [Vanilla planifolia]
MQGGEDVNIEELASNLSTYKEQLSEVKKLLAADPGNSEYVDMEKELIEVIALTEEILVTNKQAAYSRNASELEEYLSPKGFPEPEVGPSEFTGLDTHEFYKFAVGMKVQAVWSEDGEWYGATIEALTPNGYYVCYDGWGNKEEVDHCNVRPTEEGETNTLLEAERQAEVTRQAIKRKIAQAAVMEFQQRAIPTKLRIAPNDPEDVKAAKRKKIHAFKSKARIEQLEVVQNKRQNAWQQFQSTKGKTTKVGFSLGEKGRAYSSHQMIQMAKLVSPAAERV